MYYVITQFADNHYHYDRSSLSSLWWWRVQPTHRDTYLPYLIVWTYLCDFCVTMQGSAVPRETPHRRPAAAPFCTLSVGLSPAYWKDRVGENLISNLHQSLGHFWSHIQAWRSEKTRQTTYSTSPIQIPCHLCPSLVSHSDLPSLHLVFYYFIWMPTSCC